MTQKVITINGKNYPVIFTLKTLSNFEEITGKSFFSADLDLVKNRIAIICAAAIAADKDTALTVEELRGNETWDDYVKIADAYTEVMTLAKEFFPVVKVDGQQDDEPVVEEQDAKN